MVIRTGTTVVGQEHCNMHKMYFYYGESMAGTFSVSLWLDTLSDSSFTVKKHSKRPSNYPKALAYWNILPINKIIRPHIVTVKYRHMFKTENIWWPKDIADSRYAEGWWSHDKETVNRCLWIHLTITKLHHFKNVSMLMTKPTIKQYKQWMPICYSS